MSKEKKPQIDIDLVRSFVGEAHRDLDQVVAMLDEEPGLVNACVNLGGDDWETALGGASHMGRADIAQHLLDNGARMDVFCAAMMGKMAIVKAYIEDDSNVVHLKGPHGIPLISHAKRGGQDEIVALLKSHGVEA